jgi:CelD/BcsL family acetyltransferase involved in cellulose biosynthesis
LIDRKSGDSRGLRRPSIEPEATWRVEVISDAAALAQVAPAWDALWLAAMPLRPTPALRHGFISLGVRHQTPGASLHIIVVWDGDRLALAWPLIIRREQGLRVARHIGCGNNEEYAGPLIAAGVDAAAVLAVALPRLRGAVDALWVFNLADDHPAMAVLAGAGLFCARQAIVSPVVRCGQFPDLAAWRKSQSKNFRAVLGNDRRRLAKQGRLESIVVTPEQARAFCAWFFATKCQWLDSRGFGESWLRRPECQAFFVDALQDPHRSGVFASALVLDGAFIAGSLCLDGDPIEFFATAFDPRFGRYGPGSLAYEDLVGIGTASGRDIDLRITRDTYKLRWTSVGDPRATLLIALGVRALLKVLVFQLRQNWTWLRRWLGARRRRWQGVTGKSWWS